MASSTSLRRFGRILKRTSLEMRRVTSLPLPDFANVPPAKSPPFGPEISRFVCDGLEAEFTEQLRAEFSLTDELIAGMEAIVNCRIYANNLLSTIRLGDAREGRKNAILEQIQEVESRALVFLTVPPINSWGCDESDNFEGINMVFHQFLEDAESCLADANALLKRDIVSEGAVHALSLITPDLPEVLHFPGFNQNEAQTLITNISNAVFRVLSNPELRVATSTIKTIVGSACSQLRQRILNSGTVLIGGRPVVTILLIDCASVDLELVSSGFADHVRDRSTAGLAVSITGGDPEHCLNRLNYLLTFFEGAPVRPPGAVAESFCLPQSMGSEFAWYILIKASLAQAERQFAFSLSNTLPFATVLATLLGRFPEYISLFLARMATECPLLTLYADDADTVFGLANASEGVNDETLQRWRGVCRLFAAVLLARPPPGFKQRPAYLNPKLLWVTIAGVARHKEKLEISAAVLRGLIETGGYVLLKLYKRQARRLFKTLIDIVGDSQSTWKLALVTCLELLLDPKTSTENGYGVLFDDFWS